MKKWWFINNSYFLLEEYFKIETISAFYQNSNMPFLRNEFSKIFEELSTMMLFSEITYDQTKK